MILLAVLLGLFSSAGAQALHDVHKGAGIECAACHQAPPPAPVPNETCVACHGTMLVPRSGSAPISPNPHNNPHLGTGQVPVCSECHKIHGVSEVTCSVCHRGFQFDIK